jgi:ferredoxin/flavodoxin
MNIAIFYFSATGITGMVSRHIASILESGGNSINLINIITPEKRQVQYNFSEFDACIFGFPVFGGRPPSVAEEWMSTLNGRNQKCSMFFTYGARDLEWAHQVTYYLLTRANFRVVLSAEFIGSHSFNVAEGWSIAKDRPNQLDFEVATDFALQSINRFQKSVDFKIDLTGFSYKPKKFKESKGIWAELYPSRENRDCTMCYLCEKECPTGAFNANVGETNRKLCITCMHCVTICPDRVITVGDGSRLFTYFTDRLGLTQDVIELKRSKIIN